MREVEDVVWVGEKTEEMGMEGGGVVKSSVGDAPIRRRINELCSLAGMRCVCVCVRTCVVCVSKW